MAGDMAIEQVTSVESGVEPSEKEHVHVTSNGTVVDHGLHRALKQRHMQMIALGGVVGYVHLKSMTQSFLLILLCSASIWYGTGLAISYSGPVRKRHLRVDCAKC